MRHVTVLLLLLAFASIVFASTPVPCRIPYQGYLVRDGRTPWPDTTYIMEFRLFPDPLYGFPLWTETDTVQITNGVFNVHLGARVPLTPDLFQHPLLYLETKVGTDWPLSPRTRLESVPYSFVSHFANEASLAAVADSALDATHAALADSALGAAQAAYADVAGSVICGDTLWVRDGDDIHNRNSGSVIIDSPEAQPKFEVRGTGSAFRQTAGGSTLFDVGTNGSQSLLRMYRTDGTQWLRADGDAGTISVSTPSTSTNSWTGSFTNGTSDVRLAYPSAGLFVASSGSTEGYLAQYSHDTVSRLIVRKDGTVGIGVASPTAVLDIQNGTSNPPRILNTSLDYGNGVTSSQIAHRFYSRYGTSSSGVLTGVSIVNEQEGAGPSYGLTVMGGSVGVGTTSPTKELHVVGDVYVTGDIAAGSKSAVVPTSKGMIRMYCDESSEAWFSDRGEGWTTNGSSHIELDPLFLETVTINVDSPMRVHVDVYGTERAAKVLRGATGFDVFINGENQVEFSWRVEAKRKGYENLRLEGLDVSSGEKLGMRERP